MTRPGPVDLLPSDEPEGDELQGLLALRATAEKIAETATLVSANALLVQDRDQALGARDLLGA